MIYYFLILIPIILILIYMLLFKKPKYHHVDAAYYLDSMIIVVDRYTAHRLKFQFKDRLQQYISCDYDYEINKYILTVSFFSVEHKEKILKEINL